MITKSTLIVIYKLTTRTYGQTNSSMKQQHACVRVIYVYNPPGTVIQEQLPAVAEPGGAGVLQPPYSRRIHGALPKLPQYFSNMSEEEEEERRRKKKKKEGGRKKKGK